MNKFYLGVNEMHTALQDLGLSNLTAEKVNHVVTYTGTTKENIQVSVRINENSFGQTSPAAWSYCANPLSDEWISRTSFLSSLPTFVEDIIANKRFDSTYLNAIIKENVDTDVEDTDEKTEEDDLENSDKKKAHKYEYGCLMAQANDEDWDTDFVSDEELYFDPEQDPDQYGKEHEPHITILFGFHSDEIDIKDIDAFVEKIPAITDIELTGISCFKNKLFDVLKYDVESETLHKLNAEVREEFPYTSDYPDYHPHMTIAYLLPGEGDKYCEKFDEPKKLESVTKLKYSYPSDDSKDYKYYELKETEDGE